MSQNELDNLDRLLGQARRGEGRDDLHLRMKSTVGRLNSELNAAGDSGSDLISRLVRKTDWGYEVPLYHVQRATNTWGFNGFRLSIGGNVDGIGAGKISARAYFRIDLLHF